MKTVLLLTVMLAMLSLPTSVQAGNISPDLKPNNINERLRQDQQRLDRLRAQQGQKAYAESQKKHAAEQAKFNRAQKDMQKIKTPKASMPDLSR